MNDILSLTTTPELIVDNITGIESLVSLIYDDATATKINKAYYNCYLAYTNRKMIDEQKEEYFLECDKYQRKITRDIKKLQEEINQKTQILAEKKKIKESAFSVLSSIERKHIVPKGKEQLYHDLLASKGVSDRDIIFTLESFVLDGIINKNGTHYDQTNLQGLLNFNIPKFKTKFEREKEYQYNYSVLINTVLELVNSKKIADLYTTLPTYEDGNLTLDEYNFIYQNIINNIIDTIEDLKSQLSFKEYLDYDNRQLIVFEYQDLIRILGIITRVYNSNKNLFQQSLQSEEDETTLEDVPNKGKNNTVIYLPSKQDLTCLEKDFKNIPETYYSKIKDLISRFKTNSLTRSELKRFGSIDQKLAKYGELRDDQVRIIYYPLGYDKYIIIGAFQKQTNNDNSRYRIIADRFDINAFTEEQLDYLLSIKDDTETRIFDYLDEFGRKSSR